VGDEVLARATLLVGVAVAGEGERLLEGLVIDLDRGPIAVLGDDGEEVA
jgi:hypothetical protein